MRARPPASLLRLFLRSSRRQALRRARLPTALPLLALLALVAGAQQAHAVENRAAEPLSTAAAVEQAHSELWRRFVDPHGIVRDFVGELPTPDDCRLGKPNAIGWWSPIENGPMFTGLYLPAACERARRSRNPADAAQARRLAAGLLKCASVSDVPGFIARGVGTDGVCHYPLGSDDQTHPWFLGLHAYLKTDLPTADERAALTAKFREVAAALEATGWQCPCDGSFRGQFRGGYRGRLFRDAVRYLYLLRACHDVTGDTIWLERYRKALAERPEHGTHTRLEICASGYPQDRTAIARLDEFQLWIYVGCQASLAKLIAMETDDTIRNQYRSGLTTNATAALPALEAHTKFDNADKQHFGNADWRNVYSTWFPQPTQAEAQRLSTTGDKAKQGGRKSYEQRYMRNPLAAAAIVALADNDQPNPAQTRPKIEQALRHYNYEKLNMAEFFLAECAYYALPMK